MTNAYDKHDWDEGEVISEVRLDAMEDGIHAATEGVRAIEGATAEATTLDAGQPATVTWNGSKFVFGIPKGEKGDRGERGEPGAKGDPGPKGADGAAGANGETGAAGAPGKNGSSFRVSATALADNKADIAADALTPNNATIPYSVGDIVLDATTKKLYAVTVVSGGKCTIGTALATLP